MLVSKRCDLLVAVWSWLPALDARCSRPRRPDLFSQVIAVKPTEKMLRSAALKLARAILTLPGLHIVKDVAYCDLLGSGTVSVVEKVHEPPEGMAEFAKGGRCDLVLLEDLSQPVSESHGESFYDFVLGVKCLRLRYLGNRRLRLESLVPSFREKTTSLSGAKTAGSRGRRKGEYFDCAIYPAGDGPDLERRKPLSDLVAG